MLTRRKEREGIEVNTAISEVPPHTHTHTPDYPLPTWFCHPRSCREQKCISLRVYISCYPSVNSVPRVYWYGDPGESPGNGRGLLWIQRESWCGLMLMFRGLIQSWYSGQSHGLVSYLQPKVSYLWASVSALQSPPFRQASWSISYQ